MPRMPFQASNGDAWAPMTECHAQMASMSSRSPAMTPSRASLCPPMPLVAECSTRSAPKLQRPLAHAAWRRCESTTLMRALDGGDGLEVDERQRGLAGVSTNRSWVGFAAHAAAMASASVPSTKVDVDAEPGQVHLEQRRGHGEQLPGDDDVVARASTGPSTTAVTAAMPDANARPASAPSSSATASSKSRTVGLPKRE